MVYQFLSLLEFFDRGAGRRQTASIPFIVARFGGLEKFNFPQKGVCPIFEPPMNKIQNRLQNGFTGGFLVSVGSGGAGGARGSVPAGQVGPKLAGGFAGVLFEKDKKVLDVVMPCLPGQLLHRGVGFP